VALPSLDTSSAQLSTLFEVSVPIKPQHLAASRARVPIPKKKDSDPTIIIQNDGMRSVLRLSHNLFTNSSLGKPRVAPHPAFNVKMRDYRRALGDDAVAHDAVCLSPGSPLYQFCALLRQQHFHNAAALLANNGDRKCDLEPIPRQVETDMTHGTQWHGAGIKRDIELLDSTRKHEQKLGRSPHEVSGRHYANTPQADLR
jgi:hypothetical protein